MSSSLRTELWQSIEEEFGEPVAEVIQGLREVDGGNSWRTVAGCLGVSLSTLVEWRHALGLEVNASKQKYDPSSWHNGVPVNHLDNKAQAMGYDNAVDAVLDLRMVQGLTIKQAAGKLGVHYDTITNHTPPEMRGEIYNRSPIWWKVRREQVGVMTARSVEARKKFSKRQSSRKTNDFIWEGR